jgi:hypothetical protein
MNRKNIIIISCLLGITLIISGCKKKSDPVVINYRISQVLMTNAGIKYKDIYHYDAGKITEIEKFIYVDIQAGWIPRFIILYTYSGSDVTEIVKIYEAGNWENYLREDYTYSGNLITGITYYGYTANEWQVNNRAVMTWQGNLYSSMLSQSMKQGNWINEAKYEMSYVADLYQGSNYMKFDSVTSTWVDDKKDSASYVSGKIGDLVTSKINNGNWLFEWKSHYIYSGTLIARLENYLYNSLTSAWELEDFSNFTYDVNGNPVEITDMLNNKITLIYEEGMGNASQFRVPHPYPYPFPL